MSKGVEHTRMTTRTRIKTQFMVLVLIYLLLTLTGVESFLECLSVQTKQIEMIPERPILRVASGTWKPWSEFEIGSDNTTRQSGIMANVLTLLANHLNVDYMIMEPPGNSWGGMMANGSFNGMIGMVQRNEVDMALGPFSISSSRFTAVDFSTIIYDDALALVTPRPTVRKDIDGFLKPFTYKVWLLILISLVAIIISVAIIARIETKFFSIGEEDNHIGHAVLWSVKAFAQESSEWLPSHDGGRLVVTTWLFASLVFMSSYNGILVAKLSSPRVQIPIDSLEDLVSQNKIKWKIKNNGTFSHNYLKTSEKEVHQQAMAGASGFTDDCWATKKDILADKYVIICAEFIIKRIISWDFSNKGKCRLYKPRELVYPNDLFALAFRKKSSYLEKTNMVLNLLIEAGVINYWVNMHLNNITQCMKPPSATAIEEGITALSIEGLGGLFLFLIVGQLLSIMIFIGEMLFVYGIMEETGWRKNILEKCLMVFD